LKIKLNKDLIDFAYRDALHRTTRTQIYFGGSSSGKSFSFMTFAVLWALQGRSVLIVRKVGATLNKSVWPELIKAISKLKLSKYFDIRKADRTIESLISTGSIMCIGVDDEEKIKSITSPTSNCIDTIICEEATELYKSDITQLMIRQRGESTFQKRIILLFNPIFKLHWIYEQYFKPIDQVYDFNNDATIYQSNDLYIQKTTYKDNTHLGREEVETLENLKDISLYHYNVYTLGRFGVFGERIYTNVSEYTNVDISKMEIKCGLDFGWNDPTAFTVTAHDIRTKVIYIIDEIYGSKIDLDDLVEQIKTIFMSHNISLSSTITCDSEDPRSISQLKRAGLNVKSAKKGPGSVVGGIMWLMRQKLLVNKRCINTLNALNNYQWEKDKRSDLTLDTPNHDYSHLPDALRYAYEKDSRLSTTTTFSRSSLL
jgi:phage terminase large subunit